MKDWEGLVDAMHKEMILESVERTFDWLTSPFLKPKVVVFEQADICFIFRKLSSSNTLRI